MIASTLSTLGAGFADPALGSQAVFRAVLQALSHPGRSVAVAHGAQTPAAGHGASAAVLLALLDGDCTLWLSTRLAASDAGPWLRFHTGCTLVTEPGLARFAWVARGDAMPALQSLAQGSDSFPDQSATCVLDVALGGPDAWRLSGPGIRDTTTLRVDGLPDDFLPQWEANHAAFPRGIDLLLGAPAHIAGLPRTARIARAAPTREA
ncbi:phosphonate C-P lyase system protein PhnH [Verminephrobacter aporrectodeae]|uniref:Phosphonate C-P lyase system protein PhnH n=1 Tax=Verminephrobacter aporrectodeae subsp. tuberculatae TaxID=1110392 RepID=A0ABT3KWN9_9BURK|nr:phosphonate C-P lyase system protein PhnH [Verminephrobacter aporrectodeae]MCW5322754.1 phosphonate C-P lyase system protein PhnH [Verminephrobacter aporrectodeae subsp. tuberculatae]MCW8175324.1 phosphonate C-P lyase system protein PhnH [Verminephrobacter aporrectodeae subsp. tuberculatae]MCW8202850.1 phosphonate C-P lyase system protein PhnH [Verminephrobacter aporrectodeae subsp. tuberculatae]